MLYGLDLFSGIGGNTIALREYVRPIIYCERDAYAQSILLSRMADGTIEHAPIWNNVSTLDGKPWRGQIDIIVAGFPCQDISLAGKGEGLEGKRSGLFLEIVRLAKEIKPIFLFLENVPAIRTRGLSRVVKTIAELGYDCRWCVLSASEVGAPHQRERWFLLANAKDYDDRRDLPKLLKSGKKIKRSKNKHQNQAEQFEHSSSDTKILAEERPAMPSAETWKTEPSLDRVVDGLPHRLDRIKCLGNAVVPMQAKTAFEYLLGIPRLKV